VPGSIRRELSRGLSLQIAFSHSHIAYIHEHGVIKSSKLSLHISRHFVAAISYKLHDSASGVAKILPGDCRKRISALIIYYSVGHIRIATVRAMTRSKLGAARDAAILVPFALATIRSETTTLRVIFIFARRQRCLVNKW